MKPFYTASVNTIEVNADLKQDPDMKTKTLSIKISLLILMLAMPVAAQYAVVEMKDMDNDELISRSFKVTQNTPVYIDAVGAMYKSKDWKNWNPLIAYAWILNTDTREVVWSMKEDNVTRDMNSLNVSYNGALTLKPGNYTVYYSTINQKVIRISKTSGQWGHFIKNFVKMFTDDDYLLLDENRESWRLRILIKEEQKNHFQTDTSREPNHRAFVSLTGARDRDYLEKGFSVTREMPVDVYCNGEGIDSRMYDYGWITNDQTAERIWEMDFVYTRPGGGAEKNRLYSGVITLKPGNYIATYLTDDSHSFSEWNSQPPYDPAYWGLELSVRDEKSLDFIRDYKKVFKTEIVALTSVGDQQYRSDGFELKKKVSLLVLAVGEGREGRMYDYGWITDESTGSRVWEMTFSKTRFAGGSDKNRMSEEIITLPAGKYKAHYTTDGSHSFEEWNADPPHNPKKWGLTVSLISNDDSKFVGKISETSDDASVLAQITRVRDDEYMTKSFTLPKDSKVRILCLGEGKRGKMFDYGWIKNSKTGQTIWEMTYNSSTHAGGGKKNRMFDGVILLEAGSYDVTYISDDSHHFNEWNDDPPSMPDQWGITVRLVN